MGRKDGRVLFRATHSKAALLMRRRARAIARTQRASVRGALRPKRATRENPQQQLLQQFLHDSGCQSLLVPVPNRKPGLVSESQVSRAGHAGRREFNMRPVKLVGGAGEEIA